MPGYSDVSVAERVGDELQVEFVNGDVVRVRPTRFGVEGEFQVHFNAQDSPAVILSASGGDREISWIQVRTATDPKFAQEMRRQDAEEARRVGRRLRALREDRGLSQRDVAKLVGMPPSQLSKIESGSFDLRVSTVQTLLRVMGATFAEISGPDALEISQKELRRAAPKMGVPVDLVDRLFSRTPRSLTRRIFSRALAWDLTSGDIVRASVADLASNMVFKALRAKGDPASSPLLHLANACAEVVLPVVRVSAFSPLPAASVVRDEAADEHGVVTLRSLLQWTWDHGVVVLPIRAQGAFCAAAWTIRDTPVVVLKDSRASAVFWLFDLAHELGHIAHGHTRGDGIVDVDQLGPDEATVDDQEREANAYALDLLLGNPEELIAWVRNESRGNYLRFKAAVATVARQTSVSSGLLGMVAAYELTDIGQPKDRWGSATNLAVPDGDGIVEVEAALRSRVDTRGLSEEDAALVSVAVLS